MRDLIDNVQATVTELPACGMITLRGTFGDDAFVQALASCGVVIPETRRIASCDAGRVGWMSPDELLVYCEAEASADLAARLTEALAGQHALVQRVDDMRARFAISGPGARVALAKVCPVDMKTLEAGEYRRTRLAQIAAAFWTENGQDFELVCFRSTGIYARDVLTQAARHLGGVVLP